MFVSLVNQINVAISVSRLATHPRDYAARRVSTAKLSFAFMV